MSRSWTLGRLIKYLFEEDWLVDQGGFNLLVGVIVYECGKLCWLDELTQ